MLPTLDWRLFEPLVESYFPSDQWTNASCVLQAEVEAMAAACPSPANCVQTVTNTDGTVLNTFGLFQIGDRDWAPGVGPNTPFTASEWSRILEPNVNVWAASVVWSIAGWRAWSTCGQCIPPGGQPLCLEPGAPIPFPRAPIDKDAPADGPGSYQVIAACIALVTAAATLTVIDIRTGGRV